MLWVDPSDPDVYTVTVPPHHGARFTPGSSSTQYPSDMQIIDDQGQEVLFEAPFNDPWQVPVSDVERVYELRTTDPNAFCEHEQEFEIRGLSQTLCANYQLHAEFVPN